MRSETSGSRRDFSRNSGGDAGQSPEQGFDLEFDRRHIWHPYAPMSASAPVYPVASARGVRLKLADGRELIDGMASWWSVIHGYNHPALNRAARRQLKRMAHVMFGGLTHQPAIRLARRLAELAPGGIDRVFFSDSGSVAVEVAVKMALQYWRAQGVEGRSRLLTIRGGYHGDTFQAMSICDPVAGMHHLFSGAVSEQLFADRPCVRFGDSWEPSDLDSLKDLAARHCGEIAAVILEPIVQGAGGMRFYHAEYLKGVRDLCDQHSLLLIADEIATGFGRSGELFACDHANVVPDIMCVGKALTGGYLSLAATLARAHVAETISAGPGAAGALMHGPTFMANPLACAVAAASIDLLIESPWRKRVARIERELRAGLAPCAQLPQVADVRVLGAIGVVEMRRPVDIGETQRRLVDRGVWARPFGKLIYLMPAYVMSGRDLRHVCAAVREAAALEPV